VSVNETRSCTKLTVYSTTYNDIYTRTRTKVNSTIRIVEAYQIGILAYKGVTRQWEPNGREQIGGCFRGHQYNWALNEIM
jgi:hypothetical protein